MNLTKAQIMKRVRLMNAARAKKREAKQQALLASAPGVVPAINLFESGAVRTKDADHVGYHLICPAGTLELSKIYLEGETKYPLKTDAGVVGSTYIRGLGFADTIKHMVNHLEIARQGGDKEGPPIVHLAKVAWGCFTLIHYLTKCKHHRAAHQLELDTRAGWDAHYGEQK